MDSVVITKSLFESFTITSSDYKCSNPKDWKGVYDDHCIWFIYCNGVQREYNKKLNHGLPILHKVPPKRDYGRYFCIMAEKGGTTRGDLAEKLSSFFHA